MLQKDLLLPWRTVLDNAILGMDEFSTCRLRAARRRTSRWPTAPSLWTSPAFEYPLSRTALSRPCASRAAFLRTYCLDTERHSAG